MIVHHGTWYRYQGYSFRGEEPGVERNNFNYPPKTGASSLSRLCMWCVLTGRCLLRCAAERAGKTCFLHHETSFYVIVYYSNRKSNWYERSYQVESTVTRLLDEVKLPRDWSVVRYVSTCEAQLLFVFFFSLFWFGLFRFFLDAAKDVRVHDLIWCDADGGVCWLSCWLRPSLVPGEGMGVQNGCI